MNKQKLLDAKELNGTINFSDEAYNVISTLISRALDEGGLTDFYEALFEELDSEFIYYNDAWDYMKRYGDNDMELAFREGYTNICGIASYYLEQEIIDMLDEYFELSTDDFEGSSDEE